MSSGVLRQHVAASLIALCCWLPQIALACTTSDMLDLIGALEAPQGYGQVYGGVKLLPPRPITSMTVGEVMAWQRQASKTAVSSAAGRYQVIRATMQQMVNEGVVSTSDVYSPATQDKIGRHLLAQAGYRDGVSSEATLNRVSGIWAALPRVSGPNAGQSTYQGYAGNKALIGAGDYVDFANCQVALGEIERIASAARSGLRFGANFDDIIVAIKKGAENVTELASAGAIWLLLLLFTGDLVWRGLALIRQETELPDYVADTLLRLIIVSFFLFVLLNASILSQFIGEWGAGMGEDITGREGFSLSLWARDKALVMFKHLEGARAGSDVLEANVLACSLLSQLAMAVIMARIVYTYTRLYFTTIVGMFSMSFAASSALSVQARRTVLKILGIGLEIVAINVIIYVSLDLAIENSSDLKPNASAMAILVFDVLAAVLIWQIPTAVGRLSR